MIRWAKLNLKEKKLKEAVDRLKEADRQLKILRKSNNSDNEKIKYYEQVKIKQQQIIKNIKKYLS